jgi:hypothetical protein
MVLTPNHRVLHSTRYTNKIRIKRADQIGENDRILLSAEYDNKQISSPLTDDWVRLLGWTITEGGYSKNRIDLTQSETNMNHVLEIRKTLENCGVFSESIRTRQKYGKFYVEHDWYIKEPTKQELYKLIPKKTLIIELLTLPQKQLQILFDTMIKGDGDVREDGRIQFIQKNKETIDNFQILCVLLGYRCIISKRKNDIYSAFVTKHKAISIRGTNGAGKSIKRIQYNGIVWCPKTPNTTWVARRNGKPFITGNTFPMKLVEFCLKAGCAKHVCSKCGFVRERITKITYEPIRTSKIQDQPKQKQSDIPWGFTQYSVAQSKHETIGWSKCSCGAEWSKGVVLDPFFGSGTVGVVAQRMNLDWIGIELKSEYVKIAYDRIYKKSEPLSQWLQ